MIPQTNSDSSVPANVFGVELHHLVEKEGSAVPIPLLIQKAVAEIEQRGLKVWSALSHTHPIIPQTPPHILTVSVAPPGGGPLPSLWFGCSEERTQGLVRKEQFCSLSE